MFFYKLFQTDVDEPPLTEEMSNDEDETPTFTYTLRYDAEISPAEPSVENTNVIEKERDQFENKDSEYELGSDEEILDKSNPEMDNTDPSESPGKLDPAFDKETRRSSQDRPILIGGVEPASSEIRPVVVDTL